jgi:hypothetical protein
MYTVRYLFLYLVRYLFKIKFNVTYPLGLLNFHSYHIPNYPFYYDLIIYAIYPVDVGFLPLPKFSLPSHVRYVYSVHYVCLEKLCIYLIWLSRQI